MHWFGSLVSGSKAVLLRGVKPDWILRAVTEERCTIVWLLVPWAQDLLDAIDDGRVDLSRYRLEQWRLMHIGAQPVPPSLIRRWLKVFPHHSYDTNYGLSESIGPGCVHLGVENIGKVGAIGKAGYGWQTRIVDEHGIDVADGDVGELIVKGDGVMTCYYKNPQATAEVIRDGWLFTGIWQWQTAKVLSTLLTAKRMLLSRAVKISTLCRLKIFCAATAKSRTLPLSACLTAVWAKLQLQL